MDPHLTGITHYQSHRLEEFHIHETDAAECHHYKIKNKTRNAFFLIISNKLSSRRDVRIFNYKTLQVEVEVKNPLANAEDVKSEFDLWVGKTLEEGIANHPVFLPRRISYVRSLAGYSP